LRRRNGTIYEDTAKHASKNFCFNRAPVRASNLPVELRNNPLRLFKTTSPALSLRKPGLVIVVRARPAMQCVMRNHASHARMGKT
jgi:hypothetical protein